MKNRDAVSPGTPCPHWKTYSSTPTASTGPPTGYHGIKGDPGETAGCTSHTVWDVDGRWQVSPGILWGGASGRKPNPASPQASEKDASSRFPNLSYPTSRNTQQQPGGSSAPALPATLKVRGSGVKHTWNTWYFWRSRRVLGSESRDSGNWVLVSGHLWPIWSLWVNHEQVPLFLAEAPEHQLDFSPDAHPPSSPPLEPLSGHSMLVLAWETGSSVLWAVQIPSNCVSGIQIDRLSASSDKVLTSMSGILFEVSKHKYPGACIFLEWDFLNLGQAYFWGPPTIHKNWSEWLLYHFPIATEKPDTTPPIESSLSPHHVWWPTGNQRSHFLGKIYLEPYLTFYTQMSSRWIIDSNLSNIPQTYCKKP